MPLATEPSARFTRDYFRWQTEGARRSADVVVPLVISLIHPTSVVDLGCGTGSWLAAFLRHGVSDVLGVDGDYVEASDLLLPHEAFLARDLRRPLELDRTFDLALSLEAAQYLRPAEARPFVRTLTALAPVVVFSSAVPYQAYDAPNMQWPEYWCRLFGEQGYRAFDLLRPLIWNDERVDYWYAQNMLVFANAERQDALVRVADRPILPLVHPKLYLAYAETGPIPSGRLRVAARRVCWRLLR